METREYKVYTFDELTEEQKEKAIDNYRDINVIDKANEYVFTENGKID